MFKSANKDNRYSYLLQLSFQKENPPVMEGFFKIIFKIYLSLNVSVNLVVKLPAIKSSSFINCK